MHPKSIGKYQIEEFLGGGMAMVYRARDPVLGKTVAIKILTDQAPADSEFKARFLREAQIAANFEHENIVNVYDLGVDEDRPYMVMEFLRGEDLGDAIKHGRTGNLADRIRIAIQLAKALEYIHGKDTIHRDIKPDNIHVNPAGVVKLMDFGIAKPQDLNLTREGYKVGTPYYMSPEQIVGKDVTHLTDIYSFGILFWELLAGSRPTTGDSLEQTFYRILNEDLDLESLKRIGMPPSIVNLIGKCTAKNPKDRIQSFTGIREQLNKVLADLEPRSASLAATAVNLEPRGMSAASAAVSRFPIRPRLVIAGVIGASLIAVVIFISSLPIAPPPPEQIPEEPPLPEVIQTNTGTMVLVPEGTFLTGAARQEASLKAYYIDQTEVTNEAYGRFCAETGRRTPQGFNTLPANYPVTNIGIEDAREFARWAGKRLPTALEWEKAARGSEGAEFPWGDELDVDRANVFGNSLVEAGQLVAVDSFAVGDSVWGVRQMVGNVGEFVDDLAMPSQMTVDNLRKLNLLSPPPSIAEPWYVMMGGSITLKLQRGITYELVFLPVRFRSGDIGFRCAKDPL